MRYIEHIIEPEKLLLSWQAREGERQRMFVAELVRNGDDADLVYLKNSEEFSKAQHLGFKEYPGFSIEKDIYKNVLTSFMKRLPPRSRGDFCRFLDALRIKSVAEISNFALLGYSRAKLPDDDFTVIHPFGNALPPFEFMLPVQGYRYYKERLPLGSLSDEMQACFEAEPSNEHDPKAIKIIINGVTAGYVCRGLTSSFHKWLQDGLTITANVERINGTQEKPAVYLYVSVK